MLVFAIRLVRTTGAASYRVLTLLQVDNRHYPRFHHDSLLHMYISRWILDLLDQPLSFSTKSPRTSGILSTLPLPWICIIFVYHRGFRKFRRQTRTASFQANSDEVIYPFPSHVYITSIHGVNSERHDWYASHRHSYR